LFLSHNLKNAAKQVQLRKYGGLMYGRPGFDYFTCPGTPLEDSFVSVEKKINGLEDSLSMLGKLIPTCMYIKGTQE
jgi:hypothetical protein